MAELAGRCRFRDCRHVDEPGCAVAAAVAAGTLSARRVASHAKLEREVAWLRDRYDARLRAEQRRRWREIARAMRSSPRPVTRSPCRPPPPGRLDRLSPRTVPARGTSQPTTAKAATGLPPVCVTVPSGPTTSRTESSPGWLGS